jgi:hypothetical protein
MSDRPSKDQTALDCAENEAGFTRLRQALLPFFAGRCGLAGLEADEPQATHHLQWEKHKGWVLRVTVTLNPKEVGKRLKFRLLTRDKAEATERRKLVLAVLRTLGLTVKLRVQRRKGWGVSHRRKGSVPGDR